MYSFRDVFSNKCGDDRRKSSDTKVSLWKIFIFLELRVDIKEGNFALSRVFFENSREKLEMMEVIKCSDGYTKDGGSDLLRQGVVALSKEKDGDIIVIQ